MPKLNILLLAEEGIGIALLKLLLKTEHHLVAVMASPSRSTISGATVWSIAEKLGVRCWLASDIKKESFPDRLCNARVDLLISVRSRYIVPRAVLEGPLIGAFNLHSGPLPQYAGIHVVSWAIYNGETEHGVTIHHMAPDVDAGNIAYQACFPISDDDSAAQVTKQCMRHALPLLGELVKTASIGGKSAIPSIPQDLSKRVWYPPAKPNDGFVPWHEGAKRAVDFVRACDYFPFASPWGFARTRIKDREIQIIKVRKTGLTTSAPAGSVGEECGNGIQVSAGDEWVCVSEVILGTQRVAARDALNAGDLFTTPAKGKT